jgi:DNA polymerase III subunit delta'
VIILVKNWEQLQELQPIVLKMLKNSLQKDRVAHAYLFEGSRGTGKKECAYLLAKALLCISPIDKIVPCETCINCKRINHGNHPDVHLLEPDGLSIKKGQIKALQEEFSKAGVESKKKFYLITHADRMTTNAANSLLKFLEEPNSQTVAILMTEQIQQILPTILSRCQTLSFQPLSSQAMVEKLVELGVKREQAPILTFMTNNIDEAIALNGDDWFAQAQKIVVKLYEVLRRSPLESLVVLQEEWFGHFKEKEQIDRGLDLLLLIFKDLLYIQVGKSNQVVFVNERQRLEQFALHCSPNGLSRQLSSILEAKRKLQANMNPQLLMEQLVLNLQEGSTFV